VVAACYNTGQVVGIQRDTDVVGPLSPIGFNPQSLGAAQTILVADFDQKLRQARASDLSPLPGETGLGPSPNHILVDDPFIYVVNSGDGTGGNTLQILQRGPLDAGIGQDAGLQLTTVGQLNFGAATSPQAIAKLGNDLYIPLYGGPTGVGAGLVHVDVTTPSAPARRETIPFSGIDLRSFDGGTTYPRAAGVAVHRGLIYVTLSNLTPAYAPGGPGIVARVDRVAGTATPIYLGNVCLNTYWVQSTGNNLLVSCSGNFGASFDRTAVLVLDQQDQIASSWSPCATPGCIPSSAGRFAVWGNRIYVGDNASGRVFVVQLDGGQLIEQRGYSEGGQPLMPCPANPMGYSYVSDIVSIP
jgi:hypothetical protein